MFPDIPEVASMAFQPFGACRVCGLASHGVHFGVTACRACAAFFRRFVVLGLEYECLKDKDKCSLDRIRRSSCRHCRFQKCLRMGMTANNVQWNRDLHSTEAHSRRARAEEARKFDVTNKPSTSADHQSFERIKPETFIYESIEQYVMPIFLSEIPSITEGPFSKMSALEKIAEGVRVIRDDQKFADIQFENKLSLETLVPHWKAQAIKIAILAMHSMAFRRFPLSEKTRTFKAFWQNVYRLERIQMSTKIFGERCVSEKKLAISNERAIQLDSLCFDIEGVTRNRLDISLQDYKIFAERCVEEVAKPLSRLNLSNEEVAFMIITFILHNEEKITGESLDICDEFRDELCDDIHKYYQTLNIFNYAARLSKIMKIITSMKRIHYDDLGGTFVANLRRSPSI